MSELNSWLPKTGGENLFVMIKRWCVEAVASGANLLKMSIGQPVGSAFLQAREVAARTMLLDDESVHEYQDNGSPGVPGFAEAFVQANLIRSNERGIDLLNKEGISFLPTPGSKSMLPLVIVACRNQDKRIMVNIGVMTDPGYPVSKTWAGYLGEHVYDLPTNPDNEFLFNSEDIPLGTGLLMLNYPHNPSGQVATKSFWNDLCSHCEENKIRIFNDAAYAMLAYDPDACTLAEVAINYPRLSWVEGYSASKMGGNMTGWRIGAMVGSSDFIGDIATIKGNTDSGACAPQMAGVLEIVNHHMYMVADLRDTYKERNEALCCLLVESGFELAVEPGAGFFVLCLAPKMAFGQEIVDGKQFNQLMIEKTGLVTVHFGPYVRFATVGDILAQETWAKIEAAFMAADVQY